jgi:hypothetical protein
MNTNSDGNYERLRVVKSVESANKLLAARWILVDTYPQVRGSPDYQNQLPNDCGMNYVLGWHRSNGNVVDVDLPPEEGYDL